MSTHIVFPNESGLVYVAGPNTNGQLSLGTTTQTNSFTLAKLDATTNMTSIMMAADGSAHSLFLRSTGYVYSCGLNANGQLGLGTTVDASYGVLVQASAGVDLSNVAAVAAGANHSVFLLTDGSALSCGLNTSGQLGDGTNTQRTYPVKIPATITIPITTPLASYSLSAYYKFDGNLKNEVSGITSPGGTFSSSIFKSGTQSVGTTTQTSFSIQDVNKSSGSSMTVCFWFYYGGTTYQNGWFWVSKNTSNQFRALGLQSGNVIFLSGSNYTLKASYPTNEWHHLAIVGSSTAGETYLYYDGTLTLTITGNSFSETQLKTQTIIGFNTDGVKGYMDDMRFYEAALTQSDIQYLYNNPNIPTEIQIATKISYISAGNSHTLLSDVSTNIFSCGLNTNGQLGTGTLTSSSSAAQVKTDASTNLTGISQVAAGGSHSLALTTSNTVYSWGANSDGQLALGTTTDASYASLCLSAAATTLTNIAQVAAGAAHSLFLTTTGTVFASGLNSAGQLADGTTTSRSYPVQVLTAANQPLTGIAAIHATANQSYFLGRDGTIYAAGFNGTGAFGNGTTTSSSYAIQVFTANATSLKAMGYSASYARRRGATIANLQTAGFTTLEIVCAGYSKSELLAASFSLESMRSAGVSHKQLISAGYTDGELISVYMTPRFVPITMDGSPLAVNTDAIYAAGLFSADTLTVSGQTPSYRNGLYEITYSAADDGQRTGYKAFNLSLTGGVYSFWSAGGSAYNATTGNYTGSAVTTTNIRDASNISGDWIQIRFPFRILLKRLGLMARRDGNSDRLPYSLVVLGSHNGINWNMVFQQTRPPAEYVYLALNNIPITSAPTPYSYLRLIARGTKPGGVFNTQINIQQVVYNGDIYPL